MATATYNPDLPTDRDWVRRLTNDTDTPDNAFLEDAEIDALVDESIARHGEGAWTKNSAAAEALEMRAQVGALVEAGDGIKRKRIGRLEIERGEGSKAMAELRRNAKRLRAKAASLMSRRPAAFSTLGRNRRRCTSG